jgi:hypothetical protein
MKRFFTISFVLSICIKSILLAQDGELPADLKIGKHTVAEWNYMVDTTWGEGLPTSDKLILFDRCWEATDKFYPGFVNMNLDWDSIRNRYRPEIEAGISRGRFAAILAQLSCAIKEPHSVFADTSLLLSYALNPDMPVMMYRNSIPVMTYGYSNDGWFGATIAPVDDDNLIVLKSLPDHPLGIQPGDQVIGYDGTPWKELYPLLLKLELPQFPNSIGGTEEANRHRLLAGVGMNWHLFDTIEIKKYGSVDTLHLHTSLLETEKQFLFESEQLPVKGIEYPGDLDHSGLPWVLPNVLYGTIENTHIGYVYLLNTIGDDMVKNLSTAINDVVNDSTEGLIFDARWNYGGSFFWERGFNRIFNRTIDSCGFYARTDEVDHNQLQKVKSFSWRDEVFAELSDEFLNKPVAVLVGQGAMSNGDYIAYFIHTQPMSRSFGRDSRAGWIMSGNANEINTPACLTNASLYNNRGTKWNMEYPGYLTQVAGRNFGRIIDGKMVYYLHHGYEVDESKWFTQEGAHNQTDDMVERAVEWIQSVAYADSCKISETIDPAEYGSVTITARVVNEDNHNVELYSRIYTESGVFIEEVEMHENSGEFFGTYVPDGEEAFYAEISTHDIDEQSILTHPGKLYLTNSSSRHQQDKLKQVLVVYPNPMSEYCMIRMNDNTEIRKIELCDLSGRVIFTKDQIRSSTYRLYPENLKSGMYFLRVFADEIYLDKIIIR